MQQERTVRGDGAPAGRWRRVAGGTALALTLLLAACGSADEPAAAAPASTTVGPAGGVIGSPDGAQVIFPAQALAAETTVRIAKDGSGAPPLPPVAVAAGAVYAITPHGGDFAAHAEVSIPVDKTSLADNEQLVLVSAQPGDTGWTVLSGATYAHGRLRAPVMHFSYFQAVVLVDHAVPQLVTSINQRNNIGADGAALISPDFVFNDSNDANAGKAFSTLTYDYELVARLRFPTPLQSVRGALAGPTPQPCLPSSIDSNGAQWFMQRNGAGEITPVVWHKVASPAAASYPRTEGEYGTAYSGTAPGFGAVHFYGQDNPRIGGYTAGGAALPPAGNALSDDLLTWRGFAGLNPSFNGRIRIDVTIPTTCGLSIAAVPLAFQLNRAAIAAGFWGLEPYQDAFEAAAGSSLSMDFGSTVQVESVSWEYSSDALDWQGRPVQAAAGSGLLGIGQGRANYRLVLDALEATQSGYYRARACTYADPDIGRPAYCVLGGAVQVAVRSEAPVVSGQPASQVVAIGETASFTATFRGAPAPALQWQKRAVLNAAFGFTAWADIPGATAPTYTTPAVAAADSFVQYRAVASNALGTVATDAALLTVLDRFVAPTVQSQPGNLNVVVGETAVFAASIAGSTPMSYQWRRDGVDITGANSPVLTLPAVSTASAGRYELVATNGGGSITTEPAVLVVTATTPVALPPTIAAPPALLAVPAGVAANFAVAVNGTGPYTYAWFKDGTPISGADGASFGIAAAAPGDAGAYTVRVSNSAGSVLSAAATLTVTPVTPTVVAPTITTAPAGLAVLPGAGATLAVAASGSAPLQYQWKRDGVPLADATAAVLHLPAATGADAGQYSVEVRNAAGAVASTPVTLVVIGAPSITQQPAATNAAEGASATLSVVAAGSGLRYQWMRNGIGIAGATAAGYTTPALTPADNGASYSVIVYNGAGVAISSSAVLTVTAANTLTQTIQASLTSSGAMPDNISYQPSLSADGTRVAFISAGANLIPGTAIGGHAYLRDRVSNTTTRITVRPDGGESSQGTTMVKLAANGRHVVFRSRANDLVAGDTNSADDVFVRDLQTQTTVRVNVLPDGSQDTVSPGVTGLGADISADGRKVLMRSAANLAGNGATTASYRWYLRDLEAGVTRLVSGSDDGQAAVLSPDGRYVAFIVVTGSGASTVGRVKLYDDQSGSTGELIAVPSGTFPEGLGGSLSLSDGAAALAFGLRSSSVGGGAAASYSQIAVYERGTGTLGIASVTDAGVPGDRDSTKPSLSRDGRYLSFRSAAPNLSGDPASAVGSYLLVRDRVAGTTRIASRQPDGTPFLSQQGYNDNALSADGRVVVHLADVGEVVPGALGGIQVFLSPRP